MRRYHDQWPPEKAQIDQPNVGDIGTLVTLGDATLSASIADAMATAQARGIGPIYGDKWHGNWMILVLPGIKLDTKMSSRGAGANRHHTSYVLNLSPKLT